MAKPTNCAKCGKAFGEKEIRSGIQPYSLANPICEACFKELHPQLWEMHQKANRKRPS